jgi:HAMP domain-containing protein
MQRSASLTADAELPAPRRRLRNYLLDARLQLRLGAWLVGVAAALALALGWQLWRAYGEASKVVALGDPRADDAIAAMLRAEDRARLLWMGAILAGVLVALLALAIVVTHRIAGPTRALGEACRAVGAGSLARPRPLRKGDLLVGLAGEVGAMVDALRAREEAERAALDEVGRALAGPRPDLDEARRIVEKVAAAKARRLGA